MWGRYPFQPPDPDRLPSRPGVENMPPWLQERLFERRMVMITGVLDGAAASQAAAALVTLDALGADPIAVHLTSTDGELSAAFAVVDAIEAIRSAVHVVIPSQIGGAALAVLAAAAHRSAYPHARIRLSEPRTTMAAGTAEKVAAAAGEYLRELEELIVRLSEVTKAPRSRIEDDLSAGRTLTSSQAQEYGLINDIVGPTPKP